MAVKVTLGEAKTQTEKPFPKLMKSSETGNIVLFHTLEKGTIISLGEYAGNPYHIGEYSSSLNMMIFTDYNEPITIQNA